jgi:predicted transglutaminase-like cysteine proteinase
MDLYRKIVTAMYMGLPQEPEEIPRSELLEDYYNKKYPTKPIFYCGRVMVGSNNRFRCDVRDFFTLKDENLNNIVRSLKMDTMTDNQKALACLKWIITNFPYKSDSTNYGAGEFWCMPYESLNKGSGDCEDGAILLANLLLIAGVPNWKVRINCGNVFEPISKRQVGHAYLTFFDEESEKWVILDWCYYPNIKKISVREEYKKEKMYQGVWFSFNNENSWATSEGDVRNMEGFE